MGAATNRDGEVPVFELQLRLSVGRSAAEEDQNREGVRTRIIAMEPFVRGQSDFIVAADRLWSPHFFPPSLHLLHLLAIIGIVLASR
ncbi:MAG: hypothetical protein CO108_19270 [Deltaproteobacteria bacterium CG_4_9_14_3_um_filter_63_12]|nr:MAG: hypothetical protein CO108_19270 [Deltaproteobacteria bacterium CG_4_9_14_3_um_filter_63_12]